MALFILPVQRKFYRQDKQSVKFFQKQPPEVRRFLGVKESWKGVYRNFSQNSLEKQLSLLKF